MFATLYFVYGCNHLFRVYVIEDVMARYNRRSFSLATADDFPLGVASTLDPAVFTGEGVNGNFKRPELEVGGNMSDETKQHFLQDTNFGSALSTGTGHRHHVADAYSLV
jgi:hypothetical protein